MHPDQTMFMTGRGTDINIRRLFTYMASADEHSPGLVVSLDTEKAFDSVEWTYFWAVLQELSFAPNFIACYILPSLLEYARIIHCPGFFLFVGGQDKIVTSPLAYLH